VRPIQAAGTTTAMVATIISWRLQAALSSEVS
jgi:hypothetical protein